MTPPEPAGAGDLFGGERRTRTLQDGAVLLGGMALDDAPLLLAGIACVSGQAPFRRMATPGGGRMSVAMTNCGHAGWVSDAGGYRYDAADPESGTPWPVMPDAFQNLARRAAASAGFPAFEPDACLLNRYEPGARMGLHQDRNERNLDAPIVSVSLGLPAIFLWGGATRSQRPMRVRLLHGDVVVWGGPARLAFHGVATLRDGAGQPGACRYNLTLRRAL